MLLTRLLILLLVAVAGACAPKGPRSDLGDYLTRVARPLGVEAAAPAPAPAPALPRSQALQVTIQGDSLGGLDFMRLSSCALQTTIARRNSSLGRVAPPSQRLLLELAFLRDAPACIQTLRSEERDDLADLLEDNAVTKQRQLPALIFNATLGSAEYRNLWRAPIDLGAYPAKVSSLPITALEKISTWAARWLSGDYQADDAAFELALADVARGDGGEMLNALSLQAAYLARASDLLNTRADEGVLCEGGLQPQAAPVLRTVAQKYFALGIQQNAAALNQRFYALMPPIESLESALGTALPSPYRTWQTQRDAVLSNAIESPRQHVAALQNLLGSCYSEFAAENAANAD